MKLKGDKIYIKVSGGTVFTIPKNGTYELDIYEGMELEYEEIPHIRLRAYESSAKKSAVNILKRSFVSENMLKEKLLKKGHKKRFINYAVKYCRDYDLIDDKRFAKIALNSLKLKGKSKRYIIDYLKKAKIKNSLIEKAIKAVKEIDKGLIFTNLVDFDTLYGHRRDPIGYKNALEEFDKYIPEIIENLNENDLFIITADHGCDPTYKGSDHTREYIPILAFGKNLNRNVNIGIKDSFVSIAASIEKHLLGKTNLEGDFL